MADAKSQRGSFPAKLYELVEGHSRSAESEDDLVVSWCEGGLAFIVRDMTRFCEEVLPQHFCHNKWASFIRQLNLYGFRRITQGQSSGAYWHKYFQRGQPQLLRGITRSRRGNAGQQPFGQDGDGTGDDGTGVNAGGPAGMLNHGQHQQPGGQSRPWQRGHQQRPQQPVFAPQQMPPLQSLASLPPPPIISDEALLRELDSLVQQQKTAQEKLGTSPGSSSNSLYASSSAVPPPPVNIRGGGQDTAASHARLSSGSVERQSSLSAAQAVADGVNVSSDNIPASSSSSRGGERGPGPLSRGVVGGQHPQQQQQQHNTSQHHHRHQSGGVGVSQVTRGGGTSARQAQVRVEATPLGPASSSSGGGITSLSSSQQQQLTGEAPHISIHQHHPRDHHQQHHHQGVPTLSSGERTSSHSGGSSSGLAPRPQFSAFGQSRPSPPPSVSDYAVGEDLSGGGLYSNAPAGLAQAYRNGPSLKSTLQPSSTGTSVRTGGGGFSRITAPLGDSPGAPPAPWARGGSGDADPSGLLSNRKRIASHQSVHSVGSLDAGAMTEIGGHPLSKRENNARTMSKSSLASDDWDLNIADVDSLNLDEWRWNDQNQSLNRQDSASRFQADLRTQTQGLNPSTSRPSFGSNHNLFGGSPSFGSVENAPVI